MRQECILALFPCHRARCLQATVQTNMHGVSDLQWCEIAKRISGGDIGGGVGRRVQKRRQGEYAKRQLSLSTPFATSATVLYRRTVHHDKYGTPPPLPAPILTTIWQRRSIVGFFLRRNFWGKGIDASNGSVSSTDSRLANASRVVRRHDYYSHALLNLVLLTAAGTAAVRYGSKDVYRV